MFDVSYSGRSRKFPRKADKILAKRLVEKIESSKDFYRLRLRK
ncbi:MAG: hypothetical protein CHKLHMKO_00441 [Candidatus Argoarchaeum ethanivorans]|uniref:Uncharacterized protein n=1 Tax=Candidatus Argoarchaeum ethanivorans TaxID=2608793 RepID=A0A811TCU7_9EURY|nr:MAG: hypothetical protein CHKLHMKO_00441 [Candidatus Argoarchaeum ethanivorans]